MAEPIMIKAKGDGVQINLATWQGNGKTILCVHGITANCRCWDVLAAALVPEHNVLAMDLRGRGRSEKPSGGYALDYHLRDINCLLDDLEIDQTVIMGHSLGAFIGLAFAAQYPQRIDRLILVDGGGDLSAEQLNRVFEGIKPALDRLGHTFPSAESYIDKMKQAPYVHPWSAAVETYYRYEIEEVDAGVRTNIDPAHIQEEAANVRKVDCASFYAKLLCPVLILRAPNGLFSQDDLLLPEDVINKVTAEIADARRFDVAGTNHYGIVMQPHEARDQAIREFLKDM
ncbi:Hydrolase, alpha/beta fold family [Olavius sp. associated proteobacterium Delta 1]|nr:Hydrolase, alpha/beta fold family [Olavius sp. associated proteobacterium Delta 1]